MYNPTISTILANMSELTYTQYKNGAPPPSGSNNGKVKMPTGFTQIASFTAPEIDLNKDLPKIQQLDWEHMEDTSGIKSLALKANKVYFGFAATSATCNVIAIRGTQSNFEWLMNATIPQVKVPFFWFNDKKLKAAKVHVGFLYFFVMLIEQIKTATKQFDNDLPCYVCGHSLGAALATLVAPAIRLTTDNHNVHMYNYASPRIGDPIFASAYNFWIPESYRVVNLSDLIPMIPPSVIGPWTYEHVNTEWSFLHQSGNVAGNHALKGKNNENYTAAVKNKVPTNATRTYPVSGL